MGPFKELYAYGLAGRFHFMSGMSVEIAPPERLVYLTSGEFFNGGASFSLPRGFSHGLLQPVVRSFLGDDHVVHVALAQAR